MLGSYARLKPDRDYPYGRPVEVADGFVETCQRDWGQPVGLETRGPTMAADTRTRQWWARLLRASASPAAAVTLFRMNYEIDIRHLLPSISVPTLVLHSVGDRTIDVGAARYMAHRIPGARYVEMRGVDHLFWGDSADPSLNEIEEFLAGTRHEVEPDRVLATVLFTDIVGSTEKAVAIGDRYWRAVLEDFYALARRELDRFRGREIDTVGDGLFATFDGPARGIPCAHSIMAGVRALGIDVRAGLYTGECQIIGEKIGGVAVHIGARVAAKAAAGEILVSSTVRDLVAGAGLRRTPATGSAAGIRRGRAGSPRGRLPDHRSSTRSRGDHRSRRRYARRGRRRGECVASRMRPPPTATTGPTANTGDRVGEACKVVSSSFVGRGYNMSCRAGIPRTRDPNGGRA
jgi:class 3 adenylate cyclase